MIGRSENNDVSPNTSVFPILTSPQTYITEIDSTQRKTHRNKTTFSQVSSKVLDPHANDNIYLDITEDEAQAQDYFRPDPEEESKDDEKTIKEKAKNKKDNNAYETFFKPKVFFKFFTIHILYYFFLGPFIIILAPIFGKKMLYNLGFIGWNHTVIIQAIEYGCVVSFFALYYGTETAGLDPMDVYMFFSTILIAIVAMSSKYAYQNDISLKLLESIILGKAENGGDAILGPWRMQKDETIEEEIQGAILRLEIDSSLFFFNFLCEPSPALKKKLDKNNPVGQLMTLAGDMNNKRKKDLLPLEFTPREENVSSNFNSNRHFSKETKNNVAIEEDSDRNSSPSLRRTKEIPFEKPIRNVPSLSKTAESIMQSFAHFLEFKRLENSYLFGYNLIFDMLKKARDARYQHVGKSLFFVSVTRAIIPTFYRLYLVVFEDEDVPVMTSKPYIVIISFIINTLGFWGNIFTISIALLDLKSKIFCFKQIGHLISPKKVCYLKEIKIYPTLNIFDPLSLKTWSNLRRIIGEYGRKYTLRNNFNATIVMIFYFFILATFALQMLGIFKAYSSPLMMIVFGYESVLLFSIFISIMLKGAYINNQYRVHKNLLKKNKTIISDFQRLSYLYVGENAIEPDNCIYKEGLKLIKKELGEADFEGKLVTRSQKLTAMIDDIIEELKFEEENEPFTVIGVPITYTLLKGIAVAVVSLVFALSQTAINK